MKEQHHLPETREPLIRVPGSLPPFLPLKEAVIKTKLIGNANKKSDPLILKTSALDTIDSYPKDWIHTYTDGSAFKSTINTGYGATVNYPDDTKNDIFSPCGSFCSNYVAEQLAFNTSVTYINHTFDTSSCYNKHSHIDLYFI